MTSIQTIISNLKNIPPAIGISISALIISFFSLLTARASFRLSKRKHMFEQRMAGERIATTVKSLLGDNIDKLKEFRTAFGKWEVLCASCQSCPRDEIALIKESAISAEEELNLRLHELKHLPIKEEELIICLERSIASYSHILKTTNHIISIAEDAVRNPCPKMNSTSSSTQNTPAKLS